MYGYGYRYNSGLVVGAGGGAPFVNTYSLDFDGVDDYIGLENSAGLQITGAFSFSCWVKTTSTNYEGIYFKGNSISLSDIYIRKQSNGSVIFYINNLLKNVTSSTTINDGNWHHIMFVFIPSTSMTIYIDGSQDAQNTTSIPSTINNNYGNIYIAGGNNQYFNGHIDEASIFNNDQTENIATLSASPAEDLTDLSPIAWLRMGDNGAYKSPQWLLPNNENKDKVSNYTFELDGIDDYIDCGDSDDFSFGNGTTDSPFSVSTWIKIKSFGTNNVVFSKDSGLPNREYAIGFFATSKQVRFYIKNQGGNNQQSIDSTTLFALDTWYNLVCTYDGSGGSNAADGMKIYVNGVLETPTNTIKGTYTAMSNTTAPVNIGRYGAAASPLSAKVDNVSIYDSELSQSNITDIYNSGVPTTISGAIAHYKMGEDATFSSVWTVPDQVGSNDGTSSGMNIFDRVGEAPNSTSNAVSYNMDLGDRVEDTP